MTAMKFVVKYFPEMVIKSKPVRRSFVDKLAFNLRAVLRELDPDVVVRKNWDRLLVKTRLEDIGIHQRMIDAMSNTPGITYILAVNEHTLPPVEEMIERVLPVYRERLAGRSFAVRCKRNGVHDFSSMDVERELGAALLARSGASGVNLGAPDVTVELEISKRTLFVIDRRYSGIGGYPIGSIGSVLSLISGGFDSPVATFLTMKRGMRSHFLFFNLGGRDHEIAVKEVALYLWQKYGSRQRVLFISVPFEEVVAELLGNIQDSQMGVILKRMMLRVAERIARDLEVDALVTGECVAQVSSQTLRNLSVIDQVTDVMVMRPLIASDKGDIVDLANRIGTGPFAASMPEYCGVISVNPTTRAKLERIEAQERRFDMEVLDRAIANTRQTRIDRLAEEDLERIGIEVLSIPLAGSTIIDIRHPDEEALAPLRVNAPVLKIPFFQLHSSAAGLDPGASYMLYCGKGVMSRLHAGHLAETGALDVKVYAP